MLDYVALHKSCWLKKPQHYRHQAPGLTLFSPKHGECPLFLCQSRDMLTKQVDRLLNDLSGMKRTVGKRQGVAMIWIGIAYLAGFAVLLTMVERAPYDDEHRYSDND